MSRRCSDPVWLLMGHVLFHVLFEVAIEHVRGRRGTSTRMTISSAAAGQEKGAKVPGWAPQGIHCNSRRLLPQPGPHPAPCPE